MTITVVEAAPVTNLTTLARFKSMTGVTTDDDDAIIEDMIKSASDFAANYCNRIFPLQTVKESLVGNGLPDILVTITPVVSIEKVEYDTGELSIDEYEIFDAKAGIIQKSGRWTSTHFAATFDGAPSSYGEKRWHITYTGGYVLPGYGESDYGPRTLPYDLERSIIELVKMEYQHRRSDGTMTRYKIGQTQVYWGRTSSELNASGLPFSVSRALDFYKRVV